ncbi:MAG TPA: diacylglycerol kinase family protein [Gemmatimonadaceae bacterium]
MIVTIVNPAAGRGKAAQVLRAIESTADGRRKNGIFTTESPGDEARLTRQALHQGAAVIAVVGGDGTCSAIAQELLKEESDCALAVIPSGTGNDFAKTLGVDKATPRDVFQLVARGIRTRIDVGLADDHYFLNSCGFGFDASVLEATTRVRFLKGDAVYIYSALQQLFTYRGIEVSPNGAPGVKRGRMLMVTVSNGRFLGGAFKIAPRASVLDGKLEACFFSDANVVERVKLFVGALRGTHLRIPSVSTASVRELALTFANNPLMEIDGELRRARSKTVELKCIPRALAVVAAPGALG